MGSWGIGGFVLSGRFYSPKGNSRKSWTASRGARRWAMQYRLPLKNAYSGVILAQPLARANFESQRPVGKIPETLWRTSSGGLIPGSRPDPRLLAAFDREVFNAAVQPFSAVQSSLPGFRNYL